MSAAEGTAFESRLTARDFVDLFDAGWQAPAGAVGLLDFFGPHLDPAVRMSGPLSPDCRGYAQVEEFFHHLFAVVPDLHGEVAGFEIVDDEVALVSMHLAGTIGRRPVTLDLHDRLVVRDGKLVERAAKGLPISITLAILATPRVWRRAAKLLLRVRWSAPAVEPSGRP